MCKPSQEACEAWKCISTNKALGKFRGNVHDLNFFEEGLFECMSVGTCPAVRQIMEDSDEGY